MQQSVTQSTPPDKPASDPPSDARDEFGVESSDGQEAALGGSEAAQADDAAPEDVVSAPADSAEDDGPAPAPQTELETEGESAPEDDGAASASQTGPGAESGGREPAREDDGAAAAPKTEPEAAGGDREPAPEDDASASALQAELERAQDQRIRLAADFDNYRKRTDAQLRARWNHAQADLLARLLDPLDDLRRVAGCDPETATVESLAEGAVLVERKFARILEEAGVEVVDPLGEPFDPASMEAMMRVPAESEDMDEVVQLVMQRGFTLKGQLLRPARVAVYKAE